MTKVGREFRLMRRLGVPWDVAVTVTANRNKEQK